MNEDRKAKQDAFYADEPWAKLATQAGFRPWTTESSAREAFRYCAENMVHRDLVDALAAALREIARIVPKHPAGEIATAALAVYEARK